jgi:hypothetical protein
MYPRLLAPFLFFGSRAHELDSLNVNRTRFLFGKFARLSRLRTAYRANAIRPDWRILTHNYYSSEFNNQSSTKSIGKVAFTVRDRTLRLKFPPVMPVNRSFVWIRRDQVLAVGLS